MDKKKILQFIIRILVGCTFITSSLLKLLSIENFELYVYSFGIFNYVTTTILVRLLLVLEFLLGVGLVFKIAYKYTWRIAIATLICFSLFLVYAAIFRSDENCHCFGDFIELDAVPSILKNLILIGLLLCIRKQDEWHHSLKPYIVTITTAFAFFVAFLGYPMNSMYSMMFGNTEDRFNKAIYDEFIQQPQYASVIDSSRNQIIGFVSASCSHCKAGNTIMQAFFEHNKLNHNGFSNFIVSSQDSLIESFKETTKTQDFQYTHIPMGHAIKVVNGLFPTYIFLQKGVPTKSVNYKDLKESEIIEWLK